MDRHLPPVAIKIKVTSRPTECTHFNLDYSLMPAIAQHPEETSVRGPFVA